MIRKVLLFVLIVSSVTFTSCSKFQKLLKSPDNEKKFEESQKLYKEHDYYRAIQLFDLIAPVYRGTKKAETITFQQAWCYYYEANYDNASYYFNMFAQQYPLSENAEEASYMSAYCTYIQSPKYTLDQTKTYEALKELQRFVNVYPHSKRVEESNKLIDELHAKLEKKFYEIALLYYKTQSYPAAVKAFENLLEEYPGAQHKEEILFYIFKSYYEFAKKSIDDKKKERFESALESYNNLVYLFPDTKYLKEAQGYHKNVKNSLNIK
ncbi:MAG: outer membrane protein assembly factor BamD [Hyphomicrobiales bacterium]